MTPASVNDVILSVFIAKNKLVDRLCSIMKLIDLWFADMIFIRPLRLVCHCHTDTSALVIVLNIVGAEEKKIFLSLLNNGRRPHGTVRPANAMRIENAFVFFPVDEIG